MKAILRLMLMPALFCYNGTCRAQGSCYADAGRDTTICPGTCVTIGGTIPAQDTSRLCSSVIYRWSPATGLSDPNVSNPTACPSVRTTYTLKVYFFGLTSSDTCCIASSSVTIDIKSTCSNSIPELINSGGNELVATEPEDIQEEQPAIIGSLPGEKNFVGLIHQKK